MKETIIIIRGANYLSSNIKFFRSLILLFYKTFNVIPYYGWKREEWIKFLNKNNRRLIYFNWSGNFWKFAVSRASSDLLELIKNKKCVKIIACSLGAQIAINVARKDDNVVKIVSIGGVYKPHNLKIPSIDIRSKTDYFCNFFNNLFLFFSITKKTKKKEIWLNNIRHNDFHNNITIKTGKFKGKSLSELLNFCLR